MPFGKSLLAPISAGAELLGLAPQSGLLSRDSIEYDPSHLTLVIFVRVSRMTGKKPAIGWKPSPN